MDLKERLHHSNVVTLSLPATREPALNNTARVILCALRALGKEVRIQPSSAPPVVPKLTPPDQQTFAISFKGLAPWISSIYYEKDDRDLNIYFTVPANKAPGLPSLRPGLAPIVRDGEAENNDTSFPVNQVLQETSLSLLQESSKPEHTLLAAALSSLAHHQEHDLYVAELNTADFQRSSTTPRTLRHIAGQIKNSFGQQHSFLILFEDPLGARVRGLVWSPERTIQDKLMLYGNGEGRGNWVLFIRANTNLQRAREGALQALQTQSRLS